MIYRFRIILDVPDDVIRDIEMFDHASLEDFHKAIAHAFGFLGNEMATFYSSNSNWDQGKEWPLEAMELGQNSERKTPLNKIFTNKQNRLLYVYDFLNLWTFFIECMEITEAIDNVNYPNLIYTQGEVPEKAPEKRFESEKEKYDFSSVEDEFDDDFNFDEDEFEEDDFGSDDFGSEDYYE